MLPGMTVPLVGGVYAGGASVLCWGRRVGVVLAKGEGAGVMVSDTGRSTGSEVSEHLNDLRDAKRSSRLNGFMGMDGDRTDEDAWVWGEFWLMQKESRRDTSRAAMVTKSLGRGFRVRLLIQTKAV